MATRGTNPIDPDEIMPQQHIDNLIYLVAAGVWSDSLHQKFHQSRWYNWACPSVDRHKKYCAKRTRLLFANQTYARFINALVRHMEESVRTKQENSN